MGYENFIEKYSKNILKEDIFSDRQKQIAIDTIKNPSKALLGGPSVEESKNILKTKFGYTDAMINKLQESYKERFKENYKLIYKYAKPINNNNYLRLTVSDDKPYAYITATMLENPTDVGGQVLGRIKIPTGQLDSKIKSTISEFESEIGSKLQFIKKESFNIGSYKEKLQRLKESYEGELTDDDIISKVKQPELLLALGIPKGLNITKNDNLIRAKLKTLTSEERRKLLQYFNLKESFKERNDEYDDAVDDMADMIRSGKSKTQVFSDIKSKYPRLNHSSLKNDLEYLWDIEKESYKEKLQSLKEDYRDKIADEAIKMFHQGFEIDMVKSRIKNKYPAFSIADINDIVDKIFGNMSKNESFKEFNKFDDVRIKSKNLSGMIYEISGNDVVVKTIKGLVKTTKDDLELHNKEESYKENYIVTLIIDNKKEDAYGKYNDKQIDIINNEMKKPKEKRLYKLGVDWSNVDSVIIKKESYKERLQSLKEASDDVLIYVGHDVSAGIKHLQKNNIDAKGVREPGYVLVPNKDAQKAQALAIEWRKTRYESYNKKEKLTLDDVALQKYGKRFKDLTPEEKKYVNYVYAEWTDDEYNEGCNKESFKVGQTVKTASSGYGIIKKVRYNEPALPNEYYVETKHDSFWADEDDLKKESYREKLIKLKESFKERNDEYDDAMQDSMYLVKQKKSKDEIKNILIKKYPNLKTSIINEITNEAIRFAKRFESYKEASQNITTKDGKKISLEVSGSGTKGKDMETGDNYEKINGEWKMIKKESYKEKLQRLKEGKEQDELERKKYFQAQDVARNFGRKYIGIESIEKSGKIIYLIRTLAIASFTENEAMQLIKEIQDAIQFCKDLNKQNIISPWRK